MQSKLRLFSVHNPLDTDDDHLPCITCIHMRSHYVIIAHILFYVCNGIHYIVVHCITSQWPNGKSSSRIWCQHYHHKTHNNFDSCLSIYVFIYYYSMRKQNLLGVCKAIEKSSQAQISLSIRAVCECGFSRYTKRNGTLARNIFFICFLLLFIHFVI